MNENKSLIYKIEQFVKKYYVNRLIQGALSGAVLWIVFYLLINVLEYFSWFSQKARFILFLFLIIGSAYLFVFYLLIPIVNLIRFRKKMSLEQAAKLIGNFFPQIQDRLTNTLQLSQNREHDNNDLLIATLEQRTKQLQPFTFSDAVNLRSNRKYFYYFASLFIALVFLIIFLPDFSVKPVNRIVNYDHTFEKPLPYKVFIPNYHFDVMQGDDLQFSLTASGDNIPVRFFVKTNNGKQLMQNQGVDGFTFTFKNLNQSFDFVVVADDYLSQEINIEVHPNPILLSYEIQLVFPEYIKRKPEVLSAKTRLTIPEGTQITLNLSTRHAKQVLITNDSAVHELNTSDDENWKYSFKLLNTCDISVFVNNDWSFNNEPIHFQFDALPDAYPDIQVQPFTEEFSRQYYFSGLVADDYGFSRLSFNYYTENQTDNVKSIPIKLNTNDLRSSFYYSINIDSLGILQGQEVKMFFQVWDNDAFNGPKSARTEDFAYTSPSLNQLDSIAKAGEKNIIDEMQSKSSEMDAVQDEIDKLLKDFASKKELNWSDKEALNKLIEKQKALNEEWNKLHDEQQKLSEFLNENNLANQELLRKQQEINKLFEEVVSDDLKKMMEELKQMTDEIPQEKIKKMMDKIKNDNQQLKDLLDRNLSLLEQWKFEKDMAQTLEKMNDLSRQLQEVAPENNDSLKAKDAQKQFEQLQDELEKLNERGKELSEPQNFQSDEQLEQDINNDLEEAAESEEQNDSDKSSKQKNSAGQKMQQMTQSLMQQMQSADDEQQGEDAYLMRVLLENVVRASIEQEELMDAIKVIKRDDPTIPEKIQKSKELYDNFRMVEDSLRELGKRQVAVQNFIFDEVQKIDLHINNSMSALKELKIQNCISSQQFAFMSMNNLALMLAESLDQMGMSGSGSSSKSQSKPQSGKPSKQMQKLSEMQKQLGDKLKQMQQQQNNQQQGGQGMPQSEEFARMAAEQELLRQGMQQIMDELKQNGSLGNDGLNQIMEDMNKLEEDLVNKHINSKMIERNKDIVQRLLKAQNAQMEREKDEKRESNSFKGQIEKREIDALKYEEMIKKQEEFLKRNPIEYRQYYKEKIRQYFLNKNSIQP